MPSPSASPCPRCGSPASGQFCANCGGALDGAPCIQCGKPLNGGARFCHHCGATAGKAAAQTSGVLSARALAWLVPGIAVLSLVAFLIGQRLARGSADAAVPVGAPMASGAAAASRAPDISQMSPEERANRLFDRIMRYAEQGKIDSARVFAPMAINAFAVLDTTDAHMLYDMGMVGLVTGDPAFAHDRAEDILKRNPNHLLGLVLAMKAAGVRNETAARAGYLKRFNAALATERAKNLREYKDHEPDIDAVLKNPKP